MIIQKVEKLKKLPNNLLRYLLLIALAVSVSITSTAQKSKLSPYKIGISYAYGVQGGALLHDKDYNYKVNTVALQLFYPLKRGKYNFDLLIEPTIGFAQHQLLNIFFVKDSETNFETKRNEFVKNKQLSELLLIGNVVISRVLFKGESLYAIFGFGSMTINKRTERLAKGYAFVSTIGIGLSTKLSNGLYFNVSGKLRHLSNAELKQPNGGINTGSVGFGFNLKL